MTETYVIHITKKCNMDCFYCYEQDKKSEYTWEEIKQVIDNIFHSLKNDRAHIEFLGGEPMLRWDLVKQSYEYIMVNYPSSVTEFTITTNGTIVTDEIIEYLKNNKKLSMAISIDGTKYSNQLRYMKNYKCGYDVVVPNIKKLVEGKLDVQAHIVTHPFNVAWMKDNIEHLHNLGVKLIGIGTIEGTIIIDDVYCNVFKEQIEKISDYVLEHPDLGIDLFNWIKPKTDVRKYVKDLTGKVIFESYGRVKDDVTYSNNPNYVVEESESSPVSEMIYAIREYAYNFHRENKRRKKMSLKDHDENKKTIIDCVGKVGECQAVTDPVSGETSFNTILFPDFSNPKTEITNDYTAQLSEKINSHDEDCNGDCKCKDESTDMDTISAALIEIINRLDEIERAIK